MSYIDKISVGGNTHLIEPTLFAVVGGTSAAYTASIDNFELVTGVTIQLKITANNTASATLSINNGAAKAIQYKGSAITANILKATCVYTLIYDGTVWHVVGEKLDSNELTLPHKLTFGAGGVYQYDGSADVTVPVYTGGII